MQANNAANNWEQSQGWTKLNVFVTRLSNVSKLKLIPHPMKLSVFNRRSAFVLALLAATFGPSARAASEKAALDHAVSRVFPALVRITVVMEDIGDGSLEKHTGAGSGAVITKDGYIITNHHVAGKARHLVCRMSDGEEIDAKLIGTDALADIAIIKLDLEHRKKNTPLAVAKFGDSDRVRVGDTVLAMGSPMAVSQSVTKGIVSNTQLMMPDLFWYSQFRLDGESVGSLVRWIGHDAVIFGGNSGGPLVNLEGDIIGINEVGLGSLGGAIPANLAKSVAQQLIAKGHVDRSWIGLEAQPLLRGSKEVFGVLVAGVIADSPAAHAGLRPGDIVTEFDGVPANARIQEDLPLFNALVMSTPIGKEVKVKALRDGKSQTFTVTTRARGIAQDKDGEFKDWGITARNFTLLSAIERRRPDTAGVLISSVDAAGPAGSAKPPLQPEDCLLSIAGKPIRDLADLRSVTSSITKDTNCTGYVLVEFERGVSRMITAVKPKQEERTPEENARKASLGVLLQPIGPELAETIGLKDGGVRVSFVFPGGASDNAGIKAGDILTKFDDDKVRVEQESDLSHFAARIRRHRAGDKVDCALLRDGKPMKLTVTLDSDDPDRENIKTYKDRDLEFTLRDLTNKERVLARLPKDVQGARVESVKSAGWASLAHLMAGDLVLAVDGTPTPDVATAEKLLKAAVERKQHRIVLLVRRGVHTMFAEMEPTWENGNGKL
jgi:serine protease Do